jgi:histidine triad (HIT) family protein
MEEECVFCKIAKGELSCYKIYEDEEFLAFLDITPRNKGHTLIIPKKHYRWVWDMNNVGDYFEVISKIANAIRKSMNTDFVVSLIIGEEIPHAHVWLVPRFEGDGHGRFLDISKKIEISEEEMKEIAEKIKKEI